MRVFTGYENNKATAEKVLLLYKESQDPTYNGIQKHSLVCNCRNAKKFRGNKPGLGSDTRSMA